MAEGAEMRKGSRWSVDWLMRGAAALLLSTAISAQADLATIHAKPVRFLVADNQFGGCMVQLSVDPQSALPNCSSAWVTFSCDGTFLPKDVSSRMLEQTQLAFALDKNITAFVDDSRRHNGYCLAHRVDLW